MLRKQKTAVTMTLNSFSAKVTNFASLTVTVIQVIDMNIHSASGSKVCQRQKKEWVNKTILK